MDLCCCEYQEVDKSGDCVLQVRNLFERRSRKRRISFQAIRRQLDIYGLISYMDRTKIVFTSDRGPNILKALKSESVVG